MAINYQKLRLVAERLIRENGKDAEIIRQEVEPDTPPWEIPDPIPETIHPVRMVETDWTKTLRSTETVENWDIIGIISTETGIAPVQQDRIVISGIQYHLTEVRPLMPGVITMLFYITANK